MKKLYLSLGSNIGNREENIRAAIRLLEERIGNLVAQSSLIETEPWGFESDNRFINAAICLLSDLPPLEVLDITQEIERELGRKQKSADGIYHDRPIDIDILLYGDMEYSDSRLTIPHPLMHSRDFVMIPLKEIV